MKPNGHPFFHVGRSPVGTSAAPKYKGNLQLQALQPQPISLHTASMNGTQFVGSRTQWALPNAVAMVLSRADEQV